MSRRLGDRDVPTLTEQIPETALSVLERVLVARFGAGPAVELLDEFDATLERELRPLDPETERLIAANRAKQRKVLAELATTTGLRWKAWAKRDFTVALDGQPIGSIGPAGTRHSGGRTTVLGWRPREGGTELAPEKTVEAAAHAVHAAYIARAGVRPTPISQAVQVGLKPPDRSDPSDLDDLIAQACTPRSGFELSDIEGAAKAGWDIQRGTKSPWDELDRDLQAGLIETEVRDLLVRLASEPTADGRLIDHHSPSSPPWPGGRRELEHWIGRMSGRLAELTAMTDGMPASLGSFVQGRRDELAWLLTQLKFQLGEAHPGDTTTTGRDELAHWIVFTQARVVELPAEPSDDAGKGQLAEARHWAGSLRMRQQMHVRPTSSWYYGGLTLVERLRELGQLHVVDLGGDEHLALSKELIVIAVHDTPHHRWVTSTLREWTAFPAAAIEQAMREAVDDDLIDIMSGVDKAMLRDRGSDLYLRLTRIATDNTPLPTRAG